MELENPRIPAQKVQTPWAAGMAICLLLAVAAMGIGGYQLGVGNQAIQIAFLKKWINPSLYPTDLMVSTTMGVYPSYFFELLAPLAALVGVEPLYLALQMLTSFAVIATAYALGRNMFGTHRAGLVGAALLVGGHLQALAGDGIYSADFTHTYVALPVAVGALALAYRGRWMWAFGLVGILFNVHALAAAYGMLMLGAGMLAEYPFGRRIAQKEWWARAFVCGALALALASPTLAMMAGVKGQHFDAEWVNYMRIRSAEHSFPASWWAAGNADVPRFVLLFVLFILSLSFVRAGDAGRERRMTLWMAWAVVALFILGYVFSEIKPWPLMIRLQPFRASRLLLVLMIVHIGEGALEAILAGARGWVKVEGAAESTVHTAMLPGVQRVLEVAAGVIALGAVGVPGMLGWLPLAVVAATVAGIIGGHLSWRQGIVAVLGLLTAVLAWRQIDFALWPQSMAIFAPGTAGVWAGVWIVLVVACIFAGIMAWLAGQAATFADAPGAPKAALRTLSISAAVVGVFFGGMIFARQRSTGLVGDRFGDVAAWARNDTPEGALFLTPSGMGNFRIAAERSLVGDWRDGTQLYFSADFARDWIERVKDIEPGLMLSDDESRLIRRGDSLATLDDQKLLDLAKEFNADYIVLPAPVKGSRGIPSDGVALAKRTLAVAFAGKQYVVYEPRIEAPPVPAGVFDAELWNESEKFMATTVAQNIEKYRKTDVKLLVTDERGRPVQDLQVKLDQTQQAFIFGASLGFFEPNNIYPANDLKAPPVRPVELEKMPEIFNGSMIPFSSKWRYIEPEKGKYHWSDLDKYVDYCVQHDITMEFHHLTGILPDWVEDMGGVGPQRGLYFGTPIPAVQAEFNRHCLDTVGRYADRIKYFQVVNEKYMMQYVPAAFKLLREKFPHTQFGISDCVKFYDGESGGLGGWRGGRGMGDQMKGVDAIEWLEDRGIKPDFFSVHGHFPLGLWADPREMYHVFDYFQERGVRVHVSEEYLQLGGAIYGPLRSGTWTPDLQGEYLARFLTVAFSHPDVDMVNLWGLAPNGWGASNSGLIDASGNTRPAWDVLKKLFTETWRSHVSGSLGIDGSYSARVFQGKYLVTLRTADGRQLQTQAEIMDRGKMELRLKLAGGKLEVEK